MKSFKLMVNFVWWTVGVIFAGEGILGWKLNRAAVSVEERVCLWASSGGGVEYFKLLDCYASQFSIQVSTASTNKSKLFAFFALFPGCRLILFLPSIITSAA
jgi:hypothetical protein